MKLGGGGGSRLTLYVFQTLLFILQSSFFALRSCLNVFVVTCTVPLRHSRRGGGITEKRKGRGGWSEVEPHLGVLIRERGREGQAAVTDMGRQEM